MKKLLVIASLLSVWNAEAGIREGGKSGGFDLHLFYFTLTIVSLLLLVGYFKEIQAFVGKYFHRKPKKT